MALSGRIGRDRAVIRVEPAPEPADFDARVRQLGLEYLRKHPKATTRELPPHWRRCLDDLHTAYRGICAYVCIYVDKATGARTTEHFVCRSDPERGRELAYEWSNFRLACSLMNSRKGIFDTVLDPFEVKDGWFVIDFSALKLFPNPELDPDVSRQVQATIARLRLNDKVCRDARAFYYDAYILGDVSFRYLRRVCPFVALEMERQNLVRHADRAP